MESLETKRARAADFYAVRIVEWLLFGWKIETADLAVQSRASWSLACTSCDWRGGDNAAHARSSLCPKCGAVAKIISRDERRPYEPPMLERLDVDVERVDDALELARHVVAAPSSFVLTCRNCGWTTTLEASVQPALCPDCGDILYFAQIVPVAPSAPRPWWRRAFDWTRVVLELVVEKLSRWVLR